MTKYIPLTKTSGMKAVDIIEVSPVCQGSNSYPVRLKRNGRFLLRFLCTFLEKKTLIDVNDKNTLS